MTASFFKVAICLFHLLHQAQAEYLALRGDIEQATDQQHMARANTADNLSQARIDARIAELEEQKKVDDSLKR
jgi:predicted Zn-dependent protease